MTYAERLQSLPAYRQALATLQDLEKNRIYCRHDLAHFMDVARIAWIRNLEENLGYGKDLIYLTALLHDLGRIAQIREGTPHDQAGVPIAKDLLDQIAYPNNQRSPIFAAIAGHRSGRPENRDPFVNLIAWADKASRPCFICPAHATCHWPPAKKNPFFST